MDKDVLRILNEDLNWDDIINPSKYDFTIPYGDGVVHFDPMIGNRIRYEVTKNKHTFAFEVPYSEVTGNEFGFGIEDFFDNANYIIEPVLLGPNYKEAINKMQEMIANEPKASEFSDIKIPKEAIQYMIVFNKLISMGIKSQEAAKLIDSHTPGIRYLDKEVNSMLNENYKGPYGELFSRKFSEGEVLVEPNSDTLSFIVNRKGDWLTFYAPEEEYEHQYGFEVISDGGEPIIEITELGTNFKSAVNKMKDMIANEPKASEFLDVEIPENVVRLMLKWNFLKDLNIDARTAEKIIDFDSKIENQLV